MLLRKTETVEGVGIVSDNPRIIVGVPGIWPSRTALVQAVAGESGGYLFAGRVLMCITFAVDTNMCSFGSAEQLHGEDGKGTERYIQRLRAKLAADPESCLHVWLGGTVVGQLNLGRFIDPSVGYVSVFYVAPQWRGKGVADGMEQYATDWFKRRGFASARLSVTPSNVRAVRFYLRSGWRDLGPREDKLALHNMDRTFAHKSIGEEAK